MRINIKLLIYLSIYHIFLSLILFIEIRHNKINIVTLVEFLLIEFLSSNMSQVTQEISFSCDIYVKMHG